MQKKDPAALFFIDSWLTATKEMKAECRGWYLNLILHQFDKKDLPNDIEELANLADVRVSEFDKFKQVFEQVLKHKFKQNSNGRLENDVAKRILQGRETFKEKRSDAGRMSYFIKFISSKLTTDSKLISFIKKTVNIAEINTKDEQMLKQVFNQMFELYRNRNINEDENEVIYTIDNLKEYIAEGKFKFSGKEPDYWQNAISEFIGDFKYKQDFSIKHNISIPQLDKKMVDFVAKLNMSMDYKDCGGMKVHFVRWYMKYFVNDGKGVSEMRQTNSRHEVPSDIDYEKEMEQWQS